MKGNKRTEIFIMYSLHVQITLEAYRLLAARGVAKHVSLVITCMSSLHSRGNFLNLDYPQDPRIVHLRFLNIHFLYTSTVWCTQRWSIWTGPGNNMRPKLWGLQAAEAQLPCQHKDQAWALKSANFLSICLLFPLGHIEDSLSFPPIFIMFRSLVCYIEKEALYRRLCMSIMLVLVIMCIYEQ